MEGEESAYVQSLIQEAQPSFVSVLFQNQLELAKGRHCVIRVPVREMPTPRWGLLCPGVKTTPSQRPENGPASFVYYDGFDFYRTELEARDTRFADPLITRDDAVYGEGMEGAEENTFVDRKVF